MTDLREGCQHPDNSFATFRSLTIEANRLAYLRLGILFLKAAFAEPVDASNAYKIEPDLDGLDGFDLGLGLERSEIPRLRTEDTEDATSRWREAVGLFFGLGVVLFLLVSVVVGAVTILVG